MYGLLLELAARWSERGNVPDAAYWTFLCDMVEAAIRCWDRPDRGIWEVRGEPRHLVHSKVMCWAAVQRGLDLADRHGLPAPLPRWRAARDAIRAAIERHGYDPVRGVFVASFGTSDMDAALLLLPDVGFVAYDDPRMLRTADAVQRSLEREGLVLRYAMPDGLRGDEGTFLPCTFWLAECYARQGRLREAQALFDRASACATDLGLYSEEVGRDGELLGNFPQGLSHLAHISAAIALERPPATAGHPGRAEG